MGTKKTAAQIRWEKRKDKVNKARRAKRKAARIEAAKAVLKSDPTTLTNKQIVAATKAVRGSRKAKINSVRNARAYDALNVIAGGASGGVIDTAEFERSRASVVKMRELMDIVKGKTGIEGAARDLEAIKSIARIEGRADGVRMLETRNRAMRAIMDERIVGAFMARMMVVESASSTGIPDAVVVSGLEVSKIMDALRSAGYSSRGRHANAATDTDAQEDMHLGRAHVRSAV